MGEQKVMDTKEVELSLEGSFNYIIHWKLSKLTSFFLEKNSTVILQLMK